MVEMTCPYCGHQLQFEEKYRAQSRACHNCKRFIQVPRFADSDPSESSADAAIAYAEGPGKRFPAIAWCAYGVLFFLACIPPWSPWMKLGGAGIMLLGIAMTFYIFNDAHKRGMSFNRATWLGMAVLFLGIFAIPIYLFLRGNRSMNPRSIPYLLRMAVLVVFLALMGTMVTASFMR